MSCYFQGCGNRVTSREHIPPRSFFPIDQRNQLLTVPSCDEHNQAKSVDDLYVLAQICLNASPKNGAREMFQERVAPQLKHNGGRLWRLIAAGAKQLPDGSVAYPVDSDRFDRFFDALSCGIVYKVCGTRLPDGYSLGHVYHNFTFHNYSPEEILFIQHIRDFYSGQPMDFMNFGKAKTLNAPIYSVKVFGIPQFMSSITIVHNFYDIFRVTSMLTQPMPRTVCAVQGRTLAKTTE